MNAIIVEDEPRSREFLKNMVQEFCPQVVVAGTAASVEEAVAMIESVKPSLVFLDIEMHTGTGFDVLQKVKQKNFHVIFTTAYDHYAIQAIKFSAVDYLLKPIDVEELQQAVKKVEEKVGANNSSQALDILLQNLKKSPGEDFSITLSTSDGLDFVPLKTILRLEASGPYTHFFMKDKRKVIVSRHMKEYEMLLTDHYFFRVHNSHIINMNEVSRMVKTDGGYAIMSDGTNISISPKKKDEFMELMKKRLV